MMHIALCDDNERHLAETARVIEREAAERGETVALTTFVRSEAFLLAVENRELTAEIAILDIAMQGMDGITLARRINALAPRCRIIFLTGYLTYAMDVYEVDHVYFVLKEKLAERIWPAIEKARDGFAVSARDYLTFETASGMEICRYADILCFERAGRKTRVRMSEREFFIRDSLGGLAERGLPKQFVRCHQSFFVNLDAVRMMEADAFVLRDGSRAPISRACRKQVQEAAFAYWNASILQG